MQTISNRQLTLLRKLQQKKYRQKEHLFPVEGKRAVDQVIENGRLDIMHLFFDAEQKLWEEKGWQGRAEQYSSAAVNRGDYLEITDTETPQGVLALCSVPPETELKTLSAADGIIVALDRVRDPGNLGTMVRTTAWFGVQGLLVGSGTVDLFHPKVVRSTAGATGSVPYRYSGLTDDLDRLQQEGWEILLMDAGPGSMPLNEVRAGRKTVVVVGNEAHGITTELFAEGRTAVRINPGAAKTAPAVESLNASIALSIALYALRLIPGS